MKKDVRLYNVILPIWLLWLFPQLFILVAPANLAVDCMVLVVTLTALKHRGKGAVLKKLWWKFWLLGFLADFIGVLVLLPGAFLPSVFGNAAWTYDLGTAMMANPFHHPGALVWTLAAVALAGVCIYFFDKRAMKKCDLLTVREKHVVALTMAVVTAPWLFLMPVYYY